jgi:iron(III) transport system ATP-binding protein
VGSANLIKGKLTGPGTFRTDSGVTLKVTAPHVPHGKETEVALRTAYIGLEPHPGDNHVPGTVRQRLFHGDFVQYIVESALGRLIVRRPPTNLLAEGALVTLSFAPEHCVLLAG